MLRIGEDFGGRSRLHHRAGPHHAHPVGHLADDAEIVGDEQDGHAEPGLQLLEQFQNLCLNSDIESGGRFVGDQQIGVVGQRHGDHHPLALAAGQFVRQGVQAPGGFGQTHQFQQFQNPRPQRCAAESLMQNQRLADLLVDGMQGVQ